MKASGPTDDSATFHVTKVSDTDINSGNITVKGEIKAFSCTSDTNGDLDKNGGRISSKPTCYVLSK